MEIYLATLAALLSSGATVFWAFLNTNFSAALFGALAGALSAHAIALRSDRRKRLREEIAGVNNAVALSNTISNVFVAMKRQHVTDMAALYKRTFEEYVSVLINPPLAPIGLTYLTDFRDLSMPLTPIAELRKTLLDRVSSSGAAISISVVLHQSITGLAETLSERRKLFPLLHALDDANRICAYFGLRTDEGIIDERYSDQMNGICSFVDDGIYFPILLCEILVAHGEKLRSQYGRNAPRVPPIIYKKVSEEGLMPDPANYADFEQAYRKGAMPRLSFWTRAKNYVKGLLVRVW